MAGKKRILVAMSGGVDSSVAAWLLRGEGHEVTGAFVSRERLHGGSDVPAARGARRVAEFLGIPFQVVDFSEAFELLMSFFCSEYLRGRTPNPCVLCNEMIKFGGLLRKADELGLEFLATGHYARVDVEGGRWRLRRGLDPGKDQSYYLSGLTQKHLARAVFPLGERKKTDVRKLARDAGLPAAETAESQDVCFVSDRDCGRFVRGRLGAEVKPGEIVDTSGRVVGRHTGIVDFTVGQRRGVGVAMGEAVYVVDIDPRTGRVVVGRDEDLLAGEFVAESANWVSIAAPRRAIRCGVQVRYRSKPAAATVTIAGHASVHVKFDEPQRAVTPGQAAVFYQDDLVLGSGWIARER